MLQVVRVSYNSLPVQPPSFNTDRTSSELMEVVINLNFPTPQREPDSRIYISLAYMQTNPRSNTCDQITFGVELIFSVFYKSRAVLILTNQRSIVSEISTNINYRHSRQTVIVSQTEIDLKSHQVTTGKLHIQADSRHNLIGTFL